MSGKDRITPVRRRFYLTFTVIGVTMLAVAVLWVIGQIWTPISIILFSAFLVFILHTPVDFLERKGVPRFAGAVVMYVVTVLVVAAIILVFVPVIAEQLVDFIRQVPQYFAEGSAFFSQTFAAVSAYLEESGIQDIVASIASELGKWATSMASGSASAMIDMASSIGTIFLVAGVSIVVGFWILKDLPKFRKEVHRIVGPRYSDDVKVISRSFSRALGGYARSMVVSCLCVGTMTFIAYSIIGIPYPMVMALFTGLMVFIPFIGPAIAWILAGIIGLFISPLTGLLAAGLTICAQMINDNLISPRVMGGNVDLHPAIILIVIFIGAALGGVFGMLCAIPLTSAVKSIFVYYFEKHTGRQLVSEDGAFFKGQPPSGGGSKAEAGAASAAVSLTWRQRLGKVFRRPLDDVSVAEMPEAPVEAVSHEQAVAGIATPVPPLSKEATPKAAKHDIATPGSVSTEEAVIETPSSDQATPEVTSSESSTPGTATLGEACLGKAPSETDPAGAQPNTPKESL